MSQVEFQRDYFADPQRTWKRMGPRRGAYERRHLTETLAAAGLASAGKVLDLGAGMGRFSLLLAERGFDVTAVDVSAELLAELRRLDASGRIRTLVADAAALDALGAGAFDAALGFFFLHHLAALEPTLAAAARQLRPGGRVAFCEPSAYFPGFYVQVALVPGMRWRGERGIVRMRPSVFARAARAAGLVPLPPRRYGFFPGVVVDRPLGRAVERALERLPGIFLPRAFVVLSAQSPGGPDAPTPARQ